MPLFLDSSKVKSPLARSQESCGKCGLSRRCKSPKMEPIGEGRKGIFILAESPGQREDSAGQQMIGSAGAILKSHLEDLGIDLDLDCRKMNAISCYPGDSSITDLEIDCCRPRVLRAIAEFKPKVVILLGGIAIKSMMNSFTADEDEGDGGVSLWRGWRIPDQRLGCWICPTYHPSFIDGRSGGLDAAEAIFHSDLSGAIDASVEKFPHIGDVEQYLEYDLSEEDVIARIKEATKSKYSAFDYETTGLKPQRARHDIVTCAICDRWNRSFSFFRTKRNTPYLIEYLESESEKYAANAAYEDTWTEIILDRRVNNWAHDTVIAAHIFDNRRGISGLKFQSYVNFGVPDYSKDMDKYLRGDPKDANSFNHIYSAPKRTLLKYNAMDPLMTFWLAKKQRMEMGE